MYFRITHDFTDSVDNHAAYVELGRRVQSLANDQLRSGGKSFSSNRTAKHHEENDIDVETMSVDFDVMETVVDPINISKASNMFNPTSKQQNDKTSWWCSSRWRRPFLTSNSPNRRTTIGW